MLVGYSVMLVGYVGWLYWLVVVGWFVMLVGWRWVMLVCDRRRAWPNKVKYLFDGRRAASFGFSA